MKKQKQEKVNKTKLKKKKRTDKNSKTSEQPTNKRTTKTDEQNKKKAKEQNHGQTHLLFIALVGRVDLRQNLGLLVLPRAIPETEERRGTRG